MGARKIKQKEPGQFSLSGLMSSMHFKLALVAFLMFSVVLAVAKLYQPHTLPFKSIQIYGELKWINKEKLNSLILQKIDGGFFSLDMAALKVALEDQPWIESVAIRRVWPDVLQITANEQQPVAIWNDYRVINNKGQIFDPLDKELPPHLVKVSGPKGAHQSLMGHYFAIAQLIQDAGLRVSSMSINERRALQVVLTNGVRLLLGRVRSVEQSSEEVQRFVDAYNKTLSPKFDQVALIDLRYTNGLAVRWKQQTTTKQQTLGAAGRVAAQG